MKNNFSGILVLSLASLFLLLNPDSPLARDRFGSFDLELSGGYRSDALDWNTGGNSSVGEPNVLSELTWEELEIYEVSTRARLIMLNNRAPFGGMAKIRLNYGEIQNGLNQDSDYQFDNRDGEWSRSNNRADNGEVFDLTTGIGLVFQSRNGMFMISPLVGYSYHAQNLTIHDGRQTISLDNPFSTEEAKDPPPLGPIAGLARTYDAVWNSGWIGVDLEIRPTRAVELRAFVELHAADYRAEADWNLRSDLAHPVSFEHEADSAAGFVAGIGTRFGGNNLLVNFDLLYRNWQTEDGVDTFYASEGSTGVTRLNEVNWESFSASAGLTVRF